MAQEFFRQRVGIGTQLAFHMSEDSVAGALPDVKRFAVTWVYQAIDIELQIVSDVL